VAHGHQLRLIGFTALGFFAWGTTFLSRTSLSYFQQASTDPLELTATELGIINLGTSLAFCISSIAVGGIADRKQNHGQLLAVSCLLTGAFMIATNAVADHFALLLTIRILLGLACGPVFALATALARHSADPARYPVILGVVANGEAFYASALGPILILGLLARLDWTQANSILALPVLIVAATSYVATRRQHDDRLEHRSSPDLNDPARVAQSSIWRLLGYRNVWLSTLLAVLSMIALWTVLIYGPCSGPDPGSCRPPG
jgi:MFS family permease